MTGRAYHYHGPHSAAAEAGITEADVPILDGDRLDWVAALPDPFHMVACGVCGDMVAAGDVAGHVVACASQEIA